MMRQRQKNGFTLVETITALAIVGVFISFFYTLFFLNWQACEGFLARADFGQDMDKTIDQIANDGRYSTLIEVSDTATSHQAKFTNSDSEPISIYTMINNGELTVTRGADTEIMSEKLDYANSNFATDGRAIVVRMAMADQIFGQPVTLNSETEIYPRN